MHDGDGVVFWDFDGTLARRRDLWSGALRDALRAVDPANRLTVEQLKPHLSSGFPWHCPDRIRPRQTPSEWWAALKPVLIEAFTNNSVDDNTAERAADRVPQEFYRLDAWTLIDGATDALAMTQAAGYRNAILSNHPPELPTLVAELGLAAYLDRTITSAEVGAEKPNPAIFEYALDALAITDPGAAWMVGDNLVADIEGAKRVGMPAILADGDYEDSTGCTVLAAANEIVGAAAPPGTTHSPGPTRPPGAIHPPGATDQWGRSCP